MNFSTCLALVDNFGKASEVLQLTVPTDCRMPLGLLLILQLKQLVLRLEQNQSNSGDFYIMPWILLIRLSEAVSNFWNRLPRELWVLHPWKHSRLSWTGFWETWSSRKFSCSLKGGWTRLPLKVPSDANCYMILWSSNFCCDFFVSCDT